MESTHDYWMVAMKILGALGLLIYGMRMMSNSLQKMAGSQLRHILGKMTTHRWSGMLTGMFVTCAVQSSSATTMMTVSFVSAGLLTLAQAISVIMGANIGTTLTAWIMSWGYQVDLTNIVFPAFLVGMVLIYKKYHSDAGEFLFGTAFMFLSLVMLNTAGRELDLEHNEAVVSFFSSFNTNSYSSILLFLLIGTLITCIVQSSAAVMAITIMLCSTGVLPIYLGVALVMGENIGTTATANLAALGANIQARRAALAHLLFNVFGVVWVLFLFYPFVNMVCRMVGYDMSQGGHSTRVPMVLAMFHTCFNITNTAILIGLIPQMERLVCWLLPEKKSPQQEPFRLQYIHGNVMETPEIAVFQAQKEVMSFGKRVQEMFSMVSQLLMERSNKGFSALYEQIEHQEEATDKTELGIAHYLEQVSKGSLSDLTKGKIRQMLRMVGEMESIGDACYNMARIMKRGNEDGRYFNAQLTTQLQSYMQLCDNALSQMNIVLNARREEQTPDETFRIENDINLMRQRLRNGNIRAVNEREYDYIMGTMFTDVVNECEKLGDYVVNVVQARFG